MSDQNAGAPRVYLARHGETEWTISGRYTGTTDLDLTNNGVDQVVASGMMLVGSGKLIDPSRLARIFISPRKRAQATFRLLFEGEGQDESMNEIAETTDQLAELNYGDYEGLVTAEIRQRRKERGLDRERPWDIWRDGCESG
ncbi:hypothetical protein MMC14_010430, partial [Varicellaria rhodocarpa]|nr:hypothetical protein [Varicellaria rhodocarpa]